MDLYTAVQRFDRPFQFAPGDDSELPLDARGIIGDGLTCALVRVDGAIDWLCMPRFDSPAVFAAVLDREHGGITTITPAKRPFTSRQAYDADTNVLETLFEVPGQGSVRLLDFMPWTNDPRASIHEIHRRIEGIEGTVDLDLIFDPRFDYGRDVPTLDITEHGVLARGSRGERFVAVTDSDGWQPRAAGGVTQRIRVRARERRWMVLSWDAVQPEPIARYRSFEHLRATRRAWRAWANRLDYDGPWRHHVLRSALCLKLLTYAPTGAMVAAPTTSLPEWIGGPRNWDYRYAWVRDASFAIRAENLLGYADEAREFFYFIRDSCDLMRGLEIMYAVDGCRVPDEQTLPHLRGVHGSQPVRIGNGARDQLQLDIVGALVDAAHLYERFGNPLTLRSWRKIHQIVESARTLADEPDDGIWEPRSGRRHNTHSKMMMWLALDRGAGLARSFGDNAAHVAWCAHAAKMRDDICARGLDPTGTYFVKTYGGTTTDGALLTLPLYGLVSERDPRLVATIERVRAELGDGPYVRRYANVDGDGVGGPEGAFVLCGFWLAEALALIGKIDEASEIFIAHARATNHVGLLAEMIDPATHRQLGNFPQSFSHLGLINAALRIHHALRLHDEGSDEPPHLTGFLRRRP